jgi:hypothetical protein
MLTQHFACQLVNLRSACQQQFQALHLVYHLIYRLFSLSFYAAAYLSLLVAYLAFSDLAEWIVEGSKCSQAL